MGTIKYMGPSDIRRVEKGEDFGGRLAEGLTESLEWNWENKHVLNTGDHSGVSQDFWDLLLQEEDFKDVTDMARIPTNEAQQIWRAMPKSESQDEVLGYNREGSSEAPAPAPAGGSSEAGATPTTTTSTARSARGPKV